MSSDGGSYVAKRSVCSWLAVAAWVPRGRGVLLVRVEGQRALAGRCLWVCSTLRRVMELSCKPQCLCAVVGDCGLRAGVRSKRRMGQPAAV